MAATLNWNLTENATRSYLLAETLAALQSDEQAQVKSSLETCGISDKHHHNLTEVLAALEAAHVSDRVKMDARAVYQILAEAEASAHQCTVEETHFHEVGNGEAIRNVLGICLAIEALDPQTITATCVQTGSGKVQCAHGLLDIPAPATAAIIARGIPVCETKLEGEWCTPTSAAVIFHFVDEYTHE
ncbi:MAG: nickel insertion protein [Raoultibacter sp.]